MGPKSRALEHPLPSERPRKNVARFPGAMRHAAGGRGAPAFRPTDPPRRNCMMSRTGNEAPLEEEKRRGGSRTGTARGRDDLHDYLLQPRRSSGEGDRDHRSALGLGRNREECFRAGQGHRMAQEREPRISPPIHWTLMKRCSRCPRDVFTSCFPVKPRFFSNAVRRPASPIVFGSDKWAPSFPGIG